MTKTSNHFCAWCKQWFDDEWQKIQSNETPQTHGICPDCLEKMERQIDPSVVATGTGKTVNLDSVVKNFSPESEYTYRDFQEAKSSAKMMAILEIAIIAFSTAGVFFVCYLFSK